MKQSLPLLLLAAICACQTQANHQGSTGADPTVGALTSPVRRNFFGINIACVGDLNGDGIRDILVADPPTDDLVGTTGCVWVLSGKDLDVLNRWEGPSNISCRLGLGFGLADSGDVDGDGLADSMISMLAGPPLYEQRLCVVSSRSWRVLHEVRASCFTASIGINEPPFISFGDADGDGVSDFALASVLDRHTSKDAWSGESRRRDVGGKVVACSGHSGAVIWTRQDASETAAFGADLALATDFDKDGCADLYVGVTAANGIDSSVRLLSGRDGHTLGTISLSDRRAGAGSGVSLASGLDLDGDHIPDLVVGTRGDVDRVAAYSGASLNKIREWSTPATSTFQGSVDLVPNGSPGGTPNVVLTAPSSWLDESKVTLFSGASPEVLAECVRPLEGPPEFGRTVIVVPDRNDDGVDDLMLGEHDTTNGAWRGTVHILSGRTLEELGSLTRETLTDRAKAGYSVQSASPAQGAGGK